VLMELARTRAVSESDLGGALSRLAEAAGTTLDARAGVWLLTPDRSMAVCAAAWGRGRASLSLEPSYAVEAHGAYFAALEGQRTLTFGDARRDWRTRGFYGDESAEVVARLDAPIRVGGETAGYLSCESTEPGRQWTIDEENFAGSLSDLAALAMEGCERKRREESLRQLQRAVEQSIDGIAVTDIEGVILFANEAWAAMHGRSLEELPGLRLASFYAEEAGDGEAARLLEQVRSAGSFQGEMSHLSADGSRFPTWTTVTLLREETEQAMGFLAVARDITDQKRAEERGAQLEAQLQRSQKMEAVGRLAGGIAHDFNNMLMAILGCSEFLLSALGEGEPLRQDVEEIKKAGERAAGLTRQLLAFSRRQVLQPRVLDLNAVVIDVEKMLRRAIGEDIELVLSLDPQLGLVRADPAQLEQVIINLAINARDAMPTGGRLTLETLNVELDRDYSHNHVFVKPGSYAMLAVSDTGFGMDRETQARIFEPFFTTKGQGKGTGAGSGDGVRDGEAERGLHLGVQRAGEGHDVQDVPAAGGGNAGPAVGRGAGAGEPSGMRDGAAGGGRRGGAERGAAGVEVVRVSGAGGDASEACVAAGGGGEGADRPAADGRGDAADERVRPGAAAWGEKGRGCGCCICRGTAVRRYTGRGWWTRGRRSCRSRLRRRRWRGS
jgi:PAS domain S-box-containing protein